MKDLDVTICEVMEITERLYDMSGNPINNAAMVRLLDPLKKALAMQARAMNKRAEMGI